MATTTRISGKTAISKSEVLASDIMLLEHDLNGDDEDRKIALSALKEFITDEIASQLYALITSGTIAVKKADSVLVEEEGADSYYDSASNVFLKQSDASASYVQKNGTDRLITTAEGQSIADSADAIEVLNGNASVTGSVAKQIADAISGITSFEYQVVSSLPSTGTKGVIYLLPNSGSSPNFYDEYIWVTASGSVSAHFERIGSTDIDLSQYALVSQIPSVSAGNGLSQSGTTISMASAGASQSGAVTTEAQTFAGVKTFSSRIKASAGVVLPTSQPSTVENGMIWVV